MFGLIRSVKTFSKVLGVGKNVGPYMAYILYIYIFFILYTNKGVWGSKQISSWVSVIFWPFWTSKWLIFLKLELFLRPSLKTRTMTDLHILLDPDFWKCPKKGFKKIIFGHFLSHPQKLNLNILNSAWWSIGTHNVFVDTQNFFLNKKRGFRGSLRSDFDKTIDQSNVNGFSWIFKINY